MASPAAMIVSVMMATASLCAACHPDELGPVPAFTAAAARDSTPATSAAAGATAASATSATTSAPAAPTAPAAPAAARAGEAAIPAVPASEAAPVAAETAGEIVAVDPAAALVTLRHGDIRNLGMPAMTMTFRVIDPRLLHGLRPGDKVGFRAGMVDGAPAVVAIRRAE